MGPLFDYYDHQPSRFTNVPCFSTLTRNVSSLPTLTLLLNETLTLKPNADPNTNPNSLTCKRNILQVQIVIVIVDFSRLNVLFVNFSI